MENARLYNVTYLKKGESSTLLINILTCECQVWAL